ncbi:MAG: iron ABC transporter substrate-binding protein, partial [Haloarculaceae archaeon]
ERLSESDIPDKVRKFPDTDVLHDAMGWAPTYGAFKSFVTAMRLRRGPKKTRQWLNGMQKAQIQQFADEYVVSQRVADGDIDAGFAN